MNSGKIRVHIENARRKADVYHVTAERWDAACARHRTLAKRLRATTIGWDGDIIEEALKSADAVIGVPARRDDLAGRAPRLRWLHATTAGVDGFLPLDWLPRDVVFTNNRGAHGAKAEQYMRMALTMLHTRMPEMIGNQRAHLWQRLFSPSIAGRTALVVGLGDLGEAAARAARQLGLKVIGVRRTARKSRLADVVHPVTHLDRLLPAADFVVLAVPLTPETKNLLSRERLDLLKPTAGIINIARAPVADYEALAGRLRGGKLAGAVLDVVDPEPLPADSPLWDVPNLVITPHVSCDDSEHYVDISLDLWFENLARFLQGRPLRRRVDPRRGY
ncbi:MAG: D-2-hydroxyacid dehydrogenase [Betaproteobacteria bacterium]|nr:D-2-hydroxyacid dehydrogenase [Betaproteobacteria bacterium]